MVKTFSDMLAIWHCL